MKWEFIPGFNRVYRISESGKVKMDANYSSEIMSDGSFKDSFKDSKDIKHWFLKNGGYPMVTLRMSDGKKQPFMVARLVAQTFFPTSNPDLKISYRDGNVKNVAASNLDWMTQSEAHFLAVEQGRKAASNPQTGRMNSEDKEFIDMMTRQGWSKAKIADTLDRNPSTVARYLKESKV